MKTEQTKERKPLNKIRTTFTCDPVLLKTIKDEAWMRRMSASAYIEEILLKRDRKVLGVS